MTDFSNAWCVDQCPGPAPGPKSACLGGASFTNNAPYGGLKSKSNTLSTLDNTVPTSTLPAPGVTIDEAGPVNPYNPGGPVDTGPTGGYDFNSVEMVYFDGGTCLYQLPTHADATSLTASFWIRSGDIGPFENGNGTGALFNCPTNAHTTTNTVGYVILDQGSGVAMAGDLFDSATHTSVTTVNTDPVTPSAVYDWTHVMFAAHSSGGVTQYSVTSNDDIISNKVNLGDLFEFTRGVDYGTNYNMIGGAFPSAFLALLPDALNATGLIGCVCEVWIAIGQYIDITVLANRQKFHTTDALAIKWAPVNLGNDGSTPTGSKPTIYLSASTRGFRKGVTPMRAFRLNRATGRYLGMSGELQTCAFDPPGV